MRASGKEIEKWLTVARRGRGGIVSVKESKS
jgi:hypothetical protein